MNRLSDLCATLYADLKDRACGDIGRLPLEGSFVKKSIKGATYWYYQTPQVNRQRQQLSVGRESAELLEQIAKWRARKAEALGAVDARKRLVAMLGVGGAHLERWRPARLIDRMSQAGLFEAGGVLVGSFAFGCFGNMLGVSLGVGGQKESDRDVDIRVAIQRSIPEDLRQVEPGLNWPAQLIPSSPPFSLVAPDGFKIEFLTTQVTPAERSPVLIERFGVNAKPLPFMDFLLSDPQDAVVLHGAGIPVKVPDPARFALHKLAVSQLRPLGEKSKSDKDLRQASQLLEVLLEDRPGAVLLAAEAVNDREDLLANSILAGAGRLPAEQAEALRGWLKAKAWDSTLGQPVPEKPPKRRP